MRGFTGHEHLEDFRLINMNARMYDPVLGRFLSVDPYVQMPDYTQSFNRYSYCLNNPLKYTDPTGETSKGWKTFWKWVLADVLTGVLASQTAAIVTTTAAAKAANSFTFGLFGGLGDGGGAWDDARQRASNAWKISMGLLKTDGDKSSLHQAWQLISRWTWQQPMTTIGYEVANVFNNWTRLDGVWEFHGATVLLSDRMDIGQAVSIGGYITMNPNEQGGISYDNETLLHEYGHFLQTREMSAIINKYGQNAMLMQGHSAILVVG